jgi:hypothetical protein
MPGRRSGSLALRGMNGMHAMPVARTCAAVRPGETFRHTARTEPETR